jgi:hypothetical protein
MRYSDATGGPSRPPALKLWGFIGFLAITWLPAPGFADQIKFKLKKDGTVTCVDDGKVQKPGLTEIKVTGEGITPETTVAITAQFKDSNSNTQSVNLTRNDSTWTATIDTLDPKSIVVDAKVDAVSLRCGGDGPGPDTTPPTQDDAAAQAWWESEEGKSALEDFKKSTQDRFGENVKFLVHLPSGGGASPFIVPPPPPDSVSEDNYLQVLVIERCGAAVPFSLELTKCEKRDDFRIQGSAEDFKKLSAKKGRELCAEGKEFVLLAVGTPFRCGPEEALYHIQPAGSSTKGPESKVRVRPIFQLATTFVYGFDFTNETTFSADANRKIVSAEDKIGPGLRVGFTWYPWGLDAENLRWYHHWLNPFAVFDPKAPTENIILGTSITRRGGISLALGAAFHKKTVLKGVAVGDTLAGQGDVPTRKQWKGVDPGLFVGVALDSNAFKKLGEFFK